MLSYQTYFQNSSCNIDKTDAKCNNEETDGDNLFSRLTIPLLVLELILSLSDLLSDTFSGLSLTSFEETFGWGIGSFAINWFPGVVGAIQLIADYRRHKKTSITKLFVSCLLCLILCPVIPTVSMIVLLFASPRNSVEAKCQEFRKRYVKLLSFITIVRALEGCLESSLQIVYKGFLMFYGVVTFDLTSVTLIEDSFGNKLPLPFLLNLVIAILSLMKAVSTLNIVNIVRPSKLHMVTFIPFLVASSLFKLGATTILFGYFNFFAILPVAAVFMIGIYINISTLEDQEHIPRWLMAFANLFVPLFMTTKTNQDVYHVQVKNLKYQTLNCFGVYGSSLILLGILVNFSLLNMNEELPINFTKFIVIIASILSFGILATLISFNLLLDYKNKIIKYLTLGGQIILLLTVFVASITLCIIIPNDNAYIVFKTNHSHLEIIQAKEIVPIQNETIFDLRKIAIINSTDFKAELDSFETKKLDAIIIINQDAYKPSSPNTAFVQGLDLQVPTLLVRRENMVDILKLGNFTKHVELTKKINLEYYGFSHSGTGNLLNTSDI